METASTKNSSFVKWFVTSLAIVLFLYINYGVFHFFDDRLVAGQRYRQLVDDDEIQILMETTATIVRNYYVDQDRVDFASLVELLIAKLRETTVVKVTEPQTGRYLIRAQNQVLDVDSRTMSDNKFGLLLLEVCRWLSNNRQFMERYNLHDIYDSVYFVLNAILGGLDGHSALLDGDEYAELKQGTEGQFGGIGVLVGMRDNLLTVIKPLPNSPAYRAGIKKHDRIIDINGQSTFEFSLEQLVKHMRGSPGSEVRLSLLRTGELSPQSMSIKREIVQVDSIVSKRLQVGGYPVLYVQVENFSTRTAAEILQTLDSFRNRATSRYGMILDLRANPGGLLDQAVQVADLFLSEGKILSTVGRREEVENAIHDYDETNFPLVVMIDSDSASASEIVAGALQDQRRAFVVGQPSFGKGSVQTIFELPFGQALKLTIARYFTPAGRTIQERGIYPDLWLQPLFKHQDNNNLLGEYRYRNISNNLSLSSKYRSYYLQEVEQHLTNKRQIDRELDASQNLLRSVLASYRPTRTFVTSNHRSALAGLQKKLLKVNDRQVERWLQDRHNIDWQGTSSIAEQRFTFGISKHASRVVIGDRLTIPYQLKNFADSDLARVSIFVKIKGLPTYEYLLGRVAAQQKVQSEIVLPIATHSKPRVYQLQLGIASDGIAINDSIQTIDVEVVDRLVPSLSIVTSLVEEQGGIEDGKIGAGERGVITVKVTNDSEIDADDLTVKLVNLAGQQIKVITSQQQLNNLNAGTTKTARFAISASRQIFSDKLPLGISIEGQALNEAFKKQHLLQGNPSVVRAGR